MSQLGGQMIGRYRIALPPVAAIIAIMWSDAREVFQASQAQVPWSEISAWDWGGVIFMVGMVWAFFFHYEVTTHGVTLTVWGRWTNRHARIPWHEIKRVLEDSFLGWEVYIVMTDRKSYFAKGSKFLRCDNIIFWKYKSFLRDVIVRVPPDTIVDQPALDRIGFTQDDIGKLYQPPPEAADS